MDIRQLCKGLTDGQLNGLLILIGLEVWEHRKDCPDCKSPDPLTRFMCDERYVLRLHHDWIKRVMDRRAQAREQAQQATT